MSDILGCLLRLFLRGFLGALSHWGLCFTVFGLSSGQFRPSQANLFQLCEASRAAGESGCWAAREMCLSES